MKISIVTTCLNSASTIRETINSILGQKGDFELEYIITDAGSKDGTRDIIREYGDRIRLIDAVGLNQSAGINLGLRESTGDIVAFLNADDVYQDGALELVSKQFSANPDSMWLVGACPIIDENGREMHSLISNYKEFLRRHYSYFLLLCENFICQPAVFWRRGLHEKCGYFSEEEDYAMDYEFWLRIGRLYAPINVPEALSRFRRMANTKSNSSFKKQFKDDVRLGIHYAVESGNYLAIPFKLLYYIKVVLIYSFLYR